MRRFKAFLSLLVAIFLALSCSPGSNSDNGDDSGAQGLSLPNGISGVVTGDILAGVRIDLELIDGTPVFVTQTETDGSYLFSSLAPNTYNITASKDGVTFVPEKITVQYNGIGESNVDFASLFNLPDTVVSNFALTNGLRNQDMVALPAGNAAFVSTGSRVMILDPDQFRNNGQLANYTTIGGVPTFMAIPKGATAEPRLYVAVRLNSGETRLYKYKVGDGNSASELGWMTLPAGSEPTDVAVSPNGKVVYIARKDDDIIELVDAASMTAGIPNRISIESPISIDASLDDLYIVSEPVNTGLNATGELTVLPTLFHDLTKKKTVSVPLKPIRVMLSHNLQHYYVLTQPDGDNKASVLSYTSLDKQDGIWTSDANNIPTNFALMPNDDALYVTIDTLSFDGRLSIINLDNGHKQFQYMQQMSLLSGFGNKPNAVALTIRLAPVQIAGWVSHDGSGASLVGSMISFR